MSIRWYINVAVFSTVIYLSSGFRSTSISYSSAVPAAESRAAYALPSQDVRDYDRPGVPFTGKFFIGFKEAVAFRESGGQYSQVNSIGYLGKYQFGRETLRTIGVDDFERFLRSPKLQEKAFVALLSKNKWLLRDEIDKFSGQVIGGVRITESGILAAAHLGGVGSVKRFLNSDGLRKCRDCYGTSIAAYMREFGGYETRAIVADSAATVM